MAGVTTIGDVRGGRRVVCAAHPADAFAERAAALLHETTSAPVVCVAVQGDTFDSMVDELESVRADLGIGAWTFWGISGGGWLGEIYARRFPHALQRLILESICACFRVRLADPACILSPRYPQWRDALTVDEHAHDEGALAEGAEWVDVNGVGSVWQRPDGAALFVSPFPVTDAMRRITPLMWTFDARPWLHEIRTRTLVICGDSDPLVPLAHARALHDGIANSELLVLENAGHSPVMQRREDLAAAVRALIGERDV